MCEIERATKPGLSNLQEESENKQSDHKGEWAWDPGWGNKTARVLQSYTECNVTNSGSLTVTQKLLSFCSGSFGEPANTNGVSTSVTWINEEVEKLLRPRPAKLDPKTPIEPWRIIYCLELEEPWLETTCSKNPIGRNFLKRGKQIIRENCISNRPSFFT